VSTQTLDYVPPDTLEQFMLSEAFFRIAAGPVGSGKTTSCIFELLRRSMQQAQAPDGFRYTRWAIVRQTLQQLKTTVLRDIMQWLPGIAQWRVSESTIYIRIGDVISEWILIPLEDPEDQRRLLSMNLTGAWISEGIEIDAELIPPLQGRIGRFPYGTFGVPTWSGIICDTNMPPEGSPWHAIMSQPGGDTQVFIQPSGLSAHAENLPYLLQTADTIDLAIDHPLRIAQGRKYYERLARNQNEAWVTRYVRAEYGPDPSGTAVYSSTFRPTFHVVDNLEPTPGGLILIGQDFGRDPCSVVTQMDYQGRLLVLDEVPADDIGLDLHCRMFLKPKMMDLRYLGRPVAVIGDPSGVSKSSIFEHTSFDVLKQHGFVAYPAPTNDLDPRIRSLEGFFLGAIGAGPAIMIDRTRCPTLLRALNGGYRFAMNARGEANPTPVKNNHSHIVEALQYAALVAGSGAIAYIGKRFNRPQRKPAPSPAGWT
jgi:hypothetical protein